MALKRQNVFNPEKTATVFLYKKSLCSKVHFNVPKRKYMFYKILFKYKYVRTYISLKPSTLTTFDISITLDH
jgi:hypothetical protein